MAVLRDVAQLGRALRSGRRGRWFKSSHPDHEPIGGALSNKGASLSSEKAPTARDRDSSWDYIPRCFKEET